MTRETQICTVKVKCNFIDHADVNKDREKGVNSEGLDKIISDPAEAIPPPRLDPPQEREDDPRGLRQR